MRLKGGEKGCGVDHGCLHLQRGFLAHAFEKSGMIKYHARLIAENFLSVERNGQ
ncbi:hypothetical protein SDC9_173937 [bioreactor metagenome]|uniref:Uncharacterized protein n=1 Tax=bioreactor metagenome TaxID=1076179 RepID=A0A645GKW3_9ZZZZ